MVKASFSFVPFVTKTYFPVAKLTLAIPTFLWIKFFFGKWMYLNELLEGFIISKRAHFFTFIPVSCACMLKSSYNSYYNQIFLNYNLFSVIYFTFLFCLLKSNLRTKKDSYNKINSNNLIFSILVCLSERIII